MSDEKKYTDVVREEGNAPFLKFSAVRRHTLGSQEDFRKLVGGPRSERLSSVRESDDTNEELIERELNRNKYLTPEEIETLCRKVTEIADISCLTRLRTERDKRMGDDKASLEINSRLDKLSKDVYGKFLGKQDKYKIAYAFTLEYGFGLSETGERVVNLGLAHQLYNAADISLDATSGIFRTMRFVVENLQTLKNNEELYNNKLLELRKNNFLFDTKLIGEKGKDLLEPHRKNLEKLLKQQEKASKKPFFRQFASASLPGLEEQSLGDLGKKLESLSLNGLGKSSGGRSSS